MTKLTTKEVERTFLDYPIGSQKSKGMNSLVIAKFYSPVGSDVWLVTEAKRVRNSDWLLFGYFHISGWNRGCVLLSQLESIELPFGLTIERAFNLFEKTVKEHIKEEDYYL